MNNEQLIHFSKKYANRKLSPLRSIKAYCKSQCSAEDQESWKNCTFTACLLFRYRLGLGNRTKKEKHSSGEHNSTKQEPSGDRQSLLMLK